MSDMCDVCAGTGKLLDGRFCSVCCGTGSGAEEKVGLRQEVGRLRSERDSLLTKVKRAEEERDFLLGRAKVLSLALHKLYASVLLFDEEALAQHASQMIGARNALAGAADQPSVGLATNPCTNECSLVSLDDDNWQCNHCRAVFALVRSAPQTDAQRSEPCIGQGCDNYARPGKLRCAECDATEGRAK